MAAIVESSDDSITSRDMDGIITSWNRSAEERYGYSAEEMIGKHISVLASTNIPPERSGDLEYIDRKMRNGEQIRNFETERVRKSGEKFSALMTISPIRDSSGKIVGSAAIARDISERKQMENMLRKSEAKFRGLFEGSRDAITIVRVNGEFVDFNQAYVDMLGYSLDELKQFKAEDVYADSGDRIKFQQEIQRNGHVKDYELMMRRKDGGTIVCLVTAVPWKSDDGSILGYQSIAHNITKRKQMEEELRQYSTRLEKLVEERTRVLRASEEKYRSLVNNMIDAVFTIDLQGQLSFCSEGVERITGYSTQRLLSMNMKELIAPEDFAEIQKRLQARIRGEKNLPPHQFEVIKADGKHLPIEMITSPIVEEGNLVGIQGVTRDITERRQLEKMRDQFISAVTHELRTPLVSIKGYVDLALSAGPEQISKEVESQLQVAKRNTDRLLDLVNDLLDVERMQAGRLQLNPQPTDFKKIIDSCIAEIQPMITAEKLSLRTETPQSKLRMQGDDTRLCQGVINLLSNATKFSPEGGQVTIHVEEGNETLKLSVSDNGIGITKEDLPRVFDPFAAIQKTSFIKGTGLGLSLAKGLVEAHGGKIWAESAGEGKGATFTFTLPKHDT